MATKAVTIAGIRFLVNQAQIEDGRRQPDLTPVVAIDAKAMEFALQGDTRYTWVPVCPLCVWPDFKGRFVRGKVNVKIFNDRVEAYYDLN